jgi:phosphoglycolate phosphatase
VHEATLVLWDIDRTLLYAGNIDRQVYTEVFAKLLGRPPEKLPERGTGMTMPLAIRGLLLDNGVPEKEVPQLLAAMVDLLPIHLTDHLPEMLREGVLLPGATEALQAVYEAPSLIPTVVTGNLKPNALIKLRTFALDSYLDAEIGGYSSDDHHRPALVGIAQRRAGAKHGIEFTKANTVIIGDSLEDVRTGQLGGASVIGIASGTTTAHSLRDAGAQVVLPDLRDPEALLTAITSLSP